MASFSKRLAFGSILGVSNHLANLIVALFLMPFVVYSLGDRMYGFWTLAGSFIGYYGLLDFGLSSAVSRFIAGAIGAGKKEDCNRIINNAFLIYFGMGLAAFVISLVLAGCAPFFFSDPAEASLFWKIILILGINVAIGFPIKVFKGILHAQLDFEIISALRFVSLILRTVLIVFVLLKGYKILALALVTFLSGLPEYLLYVHYARKSLPDFRFDARCWNRGTATSLFSYSSHTFIAQMADELRFNIDSIVISAFVGLAAVTHYRIASVLVMHFITLITTITGVLQPFFSRLEGEENSEKIRKTLFFASKISVSVSSFIGFGLIAWGKPFIERWMGPQYLDAYPCLVILVLGITIDLWQAPTVNLLYGISMHRFYSLFNTLEAVFNVLLSLLLVRKFGIVGVAIGTFIPMTIMKLVIQPIYACRVSGIRYGEYVKKLGHTILVASVSLILPFLITVRFAVPEYLGLFAVGIASMFVYCFVLWIFEFLPEERLLLRQVFSPNT